VVVAGEATRSGWPEHPTKKFPFAMSEINDLHADQPRDQGTNPDLRQELKARQQLSWPAVAKAAIAAGAVFFFLSGGTPWSTAGTMDGVMGRLLPWGLVALLITHFILAFLYSAFIGWVIYRFKTFFAIPLGTLMGLPLYAVNWAVFSTLASKGEETRCFLVHILFALFVSILYKALSIPKVPEPAK
jgi:hypothetical protein